MKYWFDTEFMEDGHEIELLSIGIVSEDHRELYLENKEADLSKANKFVRENVIPHLHLPKCTGFVHRYSKEGCPALPRLYIQDAVLEFCSVDKPEFWTYFGAYDWVVLCQLFGRMIDLPKGWPMYTMDLKQFAKMLGDPQLPEQGKGEHHALADATME
jgi:hypothetical protein